MSSIIIKDMSNIFSWDPLINDSKTKNGYIPEEHIASLIENKKIRRESKYVKLAYLTINDFFYSQDQKHGNYSCGVVVGNTFSNLNYIEKMAYESKKYGVNKVNPGLFPFTVLNSVAGQIAIMFKVKGPNVTISENEQSSIKSLIYAYEMLVNNNDLDQVIVSNLHVKPESAFSPINDSLKFQQEYVSSFLLEKKSKSSEKSIAEISLKYRPIDQCDLLLNNQTYMEIVDSVKSIKANIISKDQLYIKYNDLKSVVITLSNEMG